MIMADFDAKRRKFLGQALTTLGVMMLPFPRGMFAQADTGTTKKGKRQHYINILDIGGWDTQYTLNYYDPSLVNSVSDVPAGWAAFNSIRYGSVGSAGVDKVVHPSGQSLAPGMKFWTANDFSKTAIVRGISAVAGHGQHQFIYGGGTSPYMASVGAIIAAYQADTRGASPLHYVKFSTGTRDWIHSGMMTGLAIPSLMPNHTSWQTLTTPRSKSATGAALTDATVLENGLGKLGSDALKKLNRDASKGVVNGYMNGYSASVMLSNSNYARSDSFLTIWLRHFNALKQEASDQLASGYGVIGDFKNDISGTGFNTEGGFITQYTQLAGTTLTTATMTTTQTGLAEVARAMSWNFALAEFLVVNDLSACVDFSASGWDSHTILAGPGVRSTLAMAGVRELIRKLGSTPNPDATGTLLDCTLISYGSEFERQARFSVDSGFWGTGHGATFSMMLAGHRTNGGKLYGSCTLGEQATGVYKGTYGIPIPLDASTGESGPTTNSMSAFSVFPTILDLIGVPIPLQQVTESKSVPILIKS